MVLHQATLLLTLLLHVTNALKCYDGVSIYPNYEQKICPMSSQYCLTIYTGQVMNGKQLVTYGCDDTTICMLLNGGCRNLQTLTFNASVCCCKNDLCNMRMSYVASPTAYPPSDPYRIIPSVVPVPVPYIPAMLPEPTPDIPVYWPTASYRSASQYGLHGVLACSLLSLILRLS